MKCQILFPGKNTKIFKNVVCWKFYSVMHVSVNYTVGKMLINCVGITLNMVKVRCWLLMTPFGVGSVMSGWVRLGARDMRLSTVNLQWLEHG